MRFIITVLPFLPFGTLTACAMEKTPLDKWEGAVFLDFGSVGRRLQSNLVQNVISNSLFFSQLDGSNPAIEMSHIFSYGQKNLFYCRH